jgi:hypothetical protein
MPKVLESESLPFWMKQKSPYGCIPTNLAAILHSFGVKKQERTDGNGNTMLYTVDERLLTELYYASIGFDKVVDTRLVSGVQKREDGTQVQVDAQTLRVDDSWSFNDWWNAIIRHLSNGHYVLISYELAPRMWHIVTAYKEENGILSYYNPDPNANARTSFDRSELDAMWRAYPRKVDPTVLIVEKLQPQ